MGSRLMLLVFMVVMVTHCGEGREHQQCPDPNSFGRNCLVYQDQCRSSRQCRAPGQQCCLVAGCGKECVNITEPTPNDSCPDPSSYGRVCIQYIDQCQSSSECGDGGACCLVAGCGKECVQPKTKPQCPPPSGLVGICVIGPNSCGSDADCSGGQLCCSEGCGSECKNPV
ncbi:WAP-type 'four-disulfide core' domain [Trinorchestia longiramus]|nr:WAP-type 'four-disulfide core' domain [Trinorchestia longiramus]